MENKYDFSPFRFFEKELTSKDGQRFTVTNFMCPIEDMERYIAELKEKEKDTLRFVLKRGKTGKLYAIVDTFEPKPKPKPAEITANDVTKIEAQEQDLPF